MVLGTGSPPLPPHTQDNTARVKKQMVDMNRPRGVHMIYGQMFDNSPQLKVD